MVGDTKSKCPVKTCATYSHRFSCRKSGQRKQSSRKKMAVKSEAKVVQGVHTPQIQPNTFPGDILTKL